ncbi:MAG: hypothetical protein EXS00_05995 [Phycisphaerales bacterium]|nr:hypothetical protein [Phycisphaerales bacterium]
MINLHTHSRSILKTLSLALTLALAATATATAQAPAAATGPVAVSSVALGLQQELDALTSMNSAAGELITNAYMRLQGMEAFLDKQKLTDSYKAFAATDNPVVPTMPFNSAFKEALRSELLVGTSRVTTVDVGLLAREISATTTLVHNSWAGVNSLMTQVASRTDFLRSKSLFDDYQEWAPGYHKAQLESQKAQSAALRTKAVAADHARDAQIKARMADLKSEWDKVAYSCSGIDYNYHFSQSVAQPGEFSQTANTGGPGFLAQTGTAGSGQVAGGQPYNTNPTYGDIMVPGLYEGPNYGQNLQNGYYGGSYWNTYGDPYHDIEGYPAGGVGGPEYGPSGIHSGFNRSSGSMPRSSPGFQSGSVTTSSAVTPIR